MTAIECQQLRKTFRTGGATVEAVAGLDFAIAVGEVVAFLGPNGAGKTTTLDMVLGLTEPTTGDVTVFGHKPRQAIRRGDVGAVLQTGGLLRDLTVLETVTAVVALQGARANVESVMVASDLTRLRGRKVSRCSGGEQQRLKFALALLTDPGLLILDEPTAGLDVAARRDFWDTMHQQAEGGRTIVFATHYLEEAQRFAQRIVLIVRGRIIADSSARRSER
ncbi:MAG: ABC transporter ATP-binding protein [Propionibacteriaceae bacterium]|nr:ABC transporter ATP-binding protein [Propionibacteriaceae bacterium]